jgi:hypothetical protein
MASDRRWCLGQLYERRKGEKGTNQHTRKPQNGASSTGSVRDQVAAETGTSKNTIQRFSNADSSLHLPSSSKVLALLEHTLKLTA